MRIANSTLKTVWQCCLGFMFMLAVPFMGTAQTYMGGSNPQPIPVTGTGGFPCVGGPTTSAATAGAIGTIGTDVAIENVTIDLTHTFDADLEITLISPAGTMLDLTSDNGGADNDFIMTVFTDGSPSITTGAAPFTGMFQAEGGTFAATFAGEDAAGDWVLSICDDAGGDSGTLNSYSITFGDAVVMPPSDDVQVCGDGNPQPIPMVGTGGFPCVGGPTTSTANVPNAGIIGTTATLTSVEIDLTHTFDSDLEIDLISPAGTVLDLTSDNGGAGDNYIMTVFADGNPNITTGGAPFSGTFEAEGGTFAATFDGESITGDWVLSICDDAGGDSGTLNTFCINFELEDAPAVPNDMCAGALPIECDQTVSGNTEMASADPTLETCGTTLTTAPGIWYSFVSDGSTYTASTCNQADYDTKIGVFTGTCDALVCVAGNDDGLGCAGFTSEVANFTTTAGETYYIYVTGFGTATGNFDLTLTCCAAPVALCQNIDIIANDSDPIVITPGDVDGGSTADCGGLVLSLSNDSFDCFDDGINEVVLTATDMFGNTAECTAEVNIINTFMASEVGCLGDLNVTLGDDCSARITPLMVVTGNNVECAANIEVTVDGTDSDIITGCGDHTYMVEIFEPVGLINEFRAADWDFVEDTGAACAGEFATATLSPGFIELSIFWGNEVSGSFTSPFDGIVSFDYDFNGFDAPFDVFIVDVNGDMVFEVEETSATTGVISEPLMAGQTIVVLINDDDFCGDPPVGNPSTATLTNFSLVSEDQILVNTCWGNINAEDKTDPIVDCPDDTDEVDAEFDLQTLDGSIDGTEPTIQLDNYSCFQSFFEPAAGVDYNYDLITFTVDPDLPATDVYNIQTASNIPGLNIAIFQGAFNEDNPCENILGGSEGAYFVDPFFGINALFAQDFRIELALEAGQTYTIMAANTSFGTTGDYVIGIVSDNGGEFIGGGFSAPQPVAVTLPLLCDDLGLIEIVGQETYQVDANGNTIPGSMSAELRAILELTGFPEISDNCGPVNVVVSDVVDAAGDCGDITVTRTFLVSDRADGVCAGTPRTDECVQIITLTRPTVFDLILPPYTATIECDENFETDGSLGGPDDNPAASITGFPFILTASGYMDLNQTYCNLGANYSDEPRIDVCEGTYKFRREWNIIDWCSPADNVIWDQFVKVADYTGPSITGVNTNIDISTSPFGCLANFPIPNPVVTDGNGCSSAFATTYTVLAFGDTFFATGNIAGNDVVQLPIGEHKLTLCAEDDCGNETCEDYNILVEDNIEPTASCDDELNVSIGGGDIANGVEGIARIFAADVDEGSNDNCGEVTLEVRRNFWANGTCHPSANRFSPWGDFVDFYCCDIDNEITIELRVIDEAGNRNICWLVVTPEDKLNPFCYAPDDVELTCADLPLAFPGDIETAYDDDFAATSIMMSAIFGGATGTDNCAVDTIVERTPNIQVNECGWGQITRRFEAWQLRPEGDANGNGAIDIGEVFRSTNTCSQRITITEVHDFKIDFPEDADADCGDPDVPTIITTATGCDVLSVNIGEPVIFEATGDECYKYSVTYDVINWCLWDGEYTGYVLPRMTEDDGEALPVDRAVEGNERPVVCYNDDEGLCIDRRHNDRDGDSSLSNCDSPELENYGRYIYTQFVKVYDSSAPVVAVGEYGGPTDNCPDLLPGQFGDDDGNCEEAVSIPFSVTDECELFDGDGNLVVSIVSAELDAFAVDANGDGDIKSNEFVAEAGPAGNVLANITDNGDGTYSFDGTFPIITSAMGDNIYHAVRILFEDGCGNQTSETIVFDVIDCKGPAPVCINGLTVTLMPQDDGGCAMAIWASDFEGSPISDCTGQGPELFGGLPRVTAYAIYRAEDVEADPNFEPSRDDTGLVLTQDDDESTVVYVYAFDEEGNYDYCETYVLVQQHVDCGSGSGTLSGVIMTENNETVEGVEVSVNGNLASMVTNTDGTYSFELELGGDYTVTPYLNAEPLNGVSTFDLVLMSKHILGVEALDSPYKRIAADVNRSETITTLDMIQLRKLILNIDTQFANNTSWRFVDASYSFPQPTNPWFQTFPELINENNFAEDILDANFVGVKIGDVNGNAQANALAGDDRTLNGQFNFEVENVSVKAGNVYTVAFTGADMASVTGFQGTLNLSGAELVDIEYGVAAAENFGLRYAAEGQITTSWNGKATSEDVLFSLVIRPTVDAELSDVINVNSRYTAAEAYGNGNTMNVGVNFSNETVVAAGFEVYQNTPNPFQVETLVGFNLPEDAEVTLTINDASGRVLTVLRGDYAAGYNTINIAKSQILGATGVLSYTITAGEYTATKTMVAVK